MAQLKIDVTADSSDAVKGFQQVQNKIAETRKQLDSSGMSAEQMFERIKNAANIAIAGISLKSLTDKVVQTRGEFQQLEVAFTTMLGSASKANSLMTQLVKTAATTPFDLKGVANGAKQLLAYGTEADQVNGTLIKLGNIAAGLSLNLNDLVWLYGTTMTQGRMFTMDLRQFQGRGIPMAEAIAKVLGTTKDKVAELVSQGKVTSDVVNKAIDTMSTGSGKFAGLMEAQSRTITGQISNIEDSIDMMFNDIGKSSEGAINAALSGVSWIIDNYKAIGSVVMGAAAAWGEYKASLMLVAAAQDAMAKQKAAVESDRASQLQDVIDQVKDAVDNASDSGEEASGMAESSAGIASTQADTAARNENTTAIDAQIAALQASLQAKVAEAQATYNSATSEAAAKSLALEAAQAKVAAAQEELVAAEATGNGIAIEAAENKLNTATVEQNAAAKELAASRERVHAASLAVATAKERENTVATQVDTINKNANTAATGLMAAVTRSATAAFQSMKAALVTNPFTAVLMGVTMLISLLPIFTSETDEATGAQQKLRDAVQDEQGKLMGYMAILENTNRSSKLYKDTVADFNELAQKYNTTQLSVNSTLQEQKEAYDALTKAIKEQATAKILSDASEDAVKKATDTERDAMDDLMDDAKNFSYTTNQIVGISSAGMVVYATKTADSIRGITSDMWGSISAEVMRHSQEMAAAFNKSYEDGEAFVQREQTTIENMLRSMGANDEDIQQFGSTIYDYLINCGEGFAENYGELERTQQQLGGLQQSTIDLGNITEQNITTYSYEQLQQAAEKVNDKINDISNNTASPKVDDSQLQYLKNLLIDINNLMPGALTKGSNKDLANRLKQAKDARDSAVYGSKEYNDANKQVATIMAEQNRRSSGLAENQAKQAKRAAKSAATTAKKNATAAKRNANDAAQRQQRIKEEQQRWDEELDKQHQEALFAQREADIVAIKDAAEKERAEKALQHDKDLYQLDQQELDFKKRNYQHNKTLFENRSKGNKN